MSKAAPSRRSMLRRTSCFVLVPSFTTVLLLLFLRHLMKQEALSLSGSVSSLSLHQTQDLSQQETQQLEPIKEEQNQQQQQQQQQQQEENDLNNINSRMTIEDSDKKDKNNDEKYDEEHSCLSSNVTFSDLFCDRKVRVSHKMGYILGIKLFKNMPPGDIWAHKKRVSDEPMKHGKKDYRDVLIVRDMYESIVSGYLYHKSGRECHLNTHGEPWIRKPRQQAEINEYWDVNLVQAQEKAKQFVRNYHTTTVSKPNNNKIINVHRTRPNQTMCEYLQETAESGGQQGVELAMLTYMHNAFKLWYLDFLTNMDRVLGTLGHDKNRTLLVCFEQLADPEQQSHVVQTILHFLFPADARGRQSTKHQRKRKRQPKPYSGGHATDHDPKPRDALKDIIRKLDVDYFDGVIAKYQPYIRCTSRYNMSL